MPTDQKIGQIKFNQTFVVSAGGVGSKYLLQRILPDADKATWKAQHLHTRRWQKFVGQDNLFVYVFGDPRNSIVSFFNRRVKRGPQHGFKRGNTPAKAQPRKRWVKGHLENIECDPDLVDLDWNLDDYLEHTEMDAFRFRHHYRCWARAAESLNIIFLRYEAIPRHEKWISQNLFPQGDYDQEPFQPRESDWRELGSAQRTKISSLYDGVATMFHQLPDVFKIENGVEVPLTEGPFKFSMGSGAGLFSIVNGMVNVLDAGDRGEIKDFSFDDTNLLYGAWNDFFAKPIAQASDCSPLGRGRFRHGVSRGRQRLTDRSEIIDCPYTRLNQPDANDIMLPPLDPQRANQIYTENFQLTPKLERQVEREIESSGIKDCLAVHCRGAGRLHGGTGYMLWKLGITGPPYDLYFRAIDSCISRAKRPLFVFSDSEDVLTNMRNRYGDLVRTRSESTLTAEGEPHKDKTLRNQADLARDIITEAYMMSHAAGLVHGNSNVSNFARYLNPTLSAYDVLGDFYTNAVEVPFWETW